MTQNDPTAQEGSVPAADPAPQFATPAAATAVPAGPRFEPVLGSDASILGGIVGAIVGAVVATVLWFGVVALTQWQIGIVAIVVGLIVGKATVFGAGGRGSIPLVVASGVMTLVALVVSEYLIIYHFVSREFGSDVISVLQPIDFVVGVAIESVQADPLTLVFWGIALFQSVAIPWSAMRPSPQPAGAAPA